MKDSILNLGVISTANIAVDRVVPALKKSGLVEVKAIASRDINRSKRWAEKLKIDKYYGNYDEMLKSTEIDAVYIALPTGMHFEWTIKSLLKGKHVICEKPLALTSEDVRQMIKLSREQKLVLMEAFMYRYHPRNLKVFEMVKNGEIGEIKTIESSFSYVLDDQDNYLMSKELGGGSLYDVGCYCVNVSRMITSLEPKEVFGTLNNTKTMVDETFAGIMRFPFGILSSFQVSMDEEPRYFYRVIGNKGLIEVPWAFVSFEKPTYIVLQKNEKMEKIKFEGANEYLLEFEDFARAILKKNPLMYDIEDSLKNAYALESLMKSAQEGKPVRV